MKYIRLLLAAASLSSASAFAQTAARPAYTPPEALSAGSVLQVIFSLALVLGIIGLVAWLLKRMNLPQHGLGKQLKVISGIAVGQRERILLVEVKDTWLVVGVAPGNVQTLHTLPKDVTPVQSDEMPPGETRFQSWLKQIAEKRNAA
jgi:flagellar protein FliO/FliZ